jgi:hypothetical protein
MRRPPKAPTACCAKITSSDEEDRGYVSIGRGSNHEAVALGARHDSLLCWQADTARANQAGIGRLEVRRCRRDRPIVPTNCLLRRNGCHQDRWRRKTPTRWMRADEPRCRQAGIDLLTPHSIHDKLQTGNPWRPDRLQFRAKSRWSRGRNDIRKAQRSTSTAENRSRATGGDRKATNRGGNRSQNAVRANQVGSDRTYFQ